MSRKELTDMEKEIIGKRKELEHITKQIPLMDARDENRFGTLKMAHEQIVGTLNQTIHDQKDYIKVLITKLGQPATHCNAPIIISGEKYSKIQRKIAKDMGVELDEE